ncbi:MAG: type II secretion system F family protein, partial [Limisphaerales bacterium]
ASGSGSIQRTVRKWRPKIESGGMTPGELLLSSTTFPNMFASIYKSGEVSGQIDDALRRLRVYYAEESTRKLDVFTKVLVTIVVLGVMITVAYFIISFYAEYFKGTSDILEELGEI